MDLLPAPASVLDSLGDVSSLCARRELPARGANALLRRNLLVYGLGGLVATSSSTGCWGRPTPR
jgi:hypothetical protein